MPNSRTELLDQKKPPQINMGWIPYWNLVPLKAELQKSFGGTGFFSNGHPTTVNRWLVEGVVDVAPCSSICLVKFPQLEIAAPVGVASDGAVQSVYLGFTHDQNEYYEATRLRQSLVQEIARQALTNFPDDPRRASQLIWQRTQDAAREVHPGKIPSVHLTPSSATSVMLTRVMYRLWYGDAAADKIGAGVVHRPGTKPVDLLIGDEALQRRSEYAHIIDLGQVWKDLTGLPFVYAIWQASSPLSLAHRRMICEAADLAQARMRVEPSVYIPDARISAGDGSRIDVESYWKLIQYRLGPAHMRGLSLFFSLARKLIQAPADGDLVVKIMRWHASEASASQFS